LPSTSGFRGARAVFERIVGLERGARFAALATSTIRAVALGVIGVALVQAIAIGLVLLVAGVPFAGLISGIALLVCIAQVPALLVTLPAIGYLWWSGIHGTGANVVFTVLLLLCGTIDNILKPLMLGRGVDAPMPVILLGALGGMAGSGIMGMFVGATLLALGYRIFMAWVETNPDNLPALTPPAATPPAE
jgi:predicted PurR-regulated permease PerM